MEQDQQIAALAPDTDGSPRAGLVKDFSPCVEEVCMNSKEFHQVIGRAS